MEYELFRSKLKPSVDGALVSGIIRSSSSGLNSHRTAVMELIIEGSIRERRERTFEKGKNSLQPNPIPQVKRTGVVPDMSIPEVQPTVPVPAPQPPSQCLPDDNTGTVTSLVTLSVGYEASQDSSTLSEPAKNIEGMTQYEEPPTDVKTNPSPLEGFVELECESCNFRRSRSRLQNGLYCERLFCPTWNGRVKCVGCGTVRVDDVDACTGCHRMFK